MKIELDNYEVKNLMDILLQSIRIIANNMNWYDDEKEQTERMRHIQTCTYGYATLLEKLKQTK